MPEEDKINAENKPAAQNEPPELTPLIPGLGGETDGKRPYLVAGGCILGALVLMIPYYYFRMHKEVKAKAQPMQWRFFLISYIFLLK